jgi:hypothetical protein
MRGEGTKKQSDRKINVRPGFAVFVWVRVVAEMKRKKINACDDDDIACTLPSSNRERRGRHSCDWPCCRAFVASSSSSCSLGGEVGREQKEKNEVQSSRTCDRQKNKK